MQNLGKLSGSENLKELARKRMGQFLDGNLMYLSKLSIVSFDDVARGRIFRARKKWWKKDSLFDAIKLDNKGRPVKQEFLQTFDYQDFDLEEMVAVLNYI